MSRRKERQQFSCSKRIQSIPSYACLRCKDYSVQTGIQAQTNGASIIKFHPQESVFLNDCEPIGIKRIR